jgi:hypothetical protein
MPGSSLNEDGRETDPDANPNACRSQAPRVSTAASAMPPQKSAGKADLTLTNAGFILGASTYGKVTQRAELPALRDCVSLGRPFSHAAPYPSSPFANVERKYVARDSFLLQQNNGYGGGYGR